MEIKQDLIPANKYYLKCPYPMEAKGIAIHNTANNAPAKNEISYMKNNNNSTSFHIAVDDVEAIQAIPFNRNAWHTGDGVNGNGNRNYIGLEICYSTGDLNTFKKAELNAVQVIVQILKQYGWGIDKVKKHQDFSGKYCPHKTLDLGWDRFINLIKETLKSPVKPSVSTTNIYRVRISWEDIKSQKGAYNSLDNAIKCAKDNGNNYKVFDSNGNIVYSKIIEPIKDKELNRYSETGKCTITADKIYFRDKPDTTNGIITGNYTKNESLFYDLVVITTKYVWISWIGANGSRRYMPITQRSNNEKWAKCV